ncbi:MAG TPA: Ig-like domain-containing protein [Steroidobacteraceae bacterium]
MCLTWVLEGCGGGSGAISGKGSTTGTTGTGTSGQTTTVLSLGSGTGSSFQPGVIAISTKSLSAGGSTSLQVSLVDQTGAAYTTGTQITFSSPCAGQGLATIAATGVTPASPSVTTSTGTASATYVASGCSGNDVITAAATANDQSLTANGTVTVAQAAIGSISFISATPSSITLKGVGSVGGSATSTVIFKVLDTSGGPRAGATVNFSLNTTVGGITIAPASATTDANGQVQTIVSGGTVATTVRVTATTTASGGGTISTESNALTVSTGIPTSANISLAVKCQNVEAWNVDGVSVPVTVSMTDRFSNPVPDGTTANFQTTLGGIQASCQTGSATAGSGACSVNWVSKAPRTVNGNPQSTTGNSNTSAAYCSTPVGAALGVCGGTTNGRSAILVTAIGEESFKDANGSGFFNPADTVAWDATDGDNNFSNGQPKPWQDTSEPFLNEWELYDSFGTPSFVLGEPFLDFNNNGKRDGPDGLVESALCEGPLCNTTGSSVAIGANNLIILSGSHANSYVVSPAGGPPYHFNNGLSLAVDIFDDRMQQMPAGTTVAAAVGSGATASITSPLPTAGWPCSSAAPYVDGQGNLIAGQLFNFTLAPANPAPAGGQVGGELYLTITTPAGLITTIAIPIQP